MSGSARANIEITASSSRLSAALQRARSTVTGWAKGLARGVGAISGNSTVGNIVGNLQGMATGMLVDQAKGVIDFERSLTRFGIAASQTPEKLAKLRAGISDVSKETAVSRDQILAGAQTYVDLTGDAAGATNAMRSFARIAQASGSSVEDVAQAAASMQMSMKLDSSQIEEAFSGLISQGKAGAVSLKDMASELSTLGPMMAKFQGGKGAEGIRTMGAAFQVVRQGAGSAAEANTQLQSVITGVIAHAKTFEKAGVKIYNKDPKTGVKTLRSFASIIEAIGKSKLMKDPTALGKAFGRTEALAAFSTLVQNKKLYGELLESGKDATAVQKDLDTYLNSTAGKLDKAFNTLKVTVAEALTPERIEGFVNAMGKLVEVLIKAVGLVEQLGQKVDVEGALGKKIEQSEVDKAQGLTSEQKQARAAELERKAKALDRSDAMGTRGAREGFRAAAKKLRGQAGTWGQASDGGAGFDAQQATIAVAQVIQAAKEQKQGKGPAIDADSTLGLILGELKKLNANGGKPTTTTIKADGNQIAKTTSNATDTRRAP